MLHYFYFLVEDISGENLINILMDKVRMEFCQKDIKFVCKHFRGCGSLKKQVRKTDVKTQSLLNDLPQYLKGLQGLADMEAASVVIVVDSDENDVEQFRQELEEVGRSNAPKLDCVYAIAVQEIEAWLLGDKEAIWRAYPDAKKSRLLNKYDAQKEEEKGKWETLADVVYKGGTRKLRQSPSYNEIGKQKSEWAEKIGREMNLDANVSPSFNRFINAVRERLNS